METPIVAAKQSEVIATEKTRMIRLRVFDQGARRTKVALLDGATTARSTK
jgi:hypothetical protein